MTSWKATEVRLARRPNGIPQERDFVVAKTDMGGPDEGEFVVENAYLSVDPFLRMAISEDVPITTPLPIGGTIPGLAIGRIASSCHPDFEVGEVVIGRFGWRSVSRSDGTHVLRFDRPAGPCAAALGVLGMPGFTAWCGLNLIASPQPGDTVFISAGAGPVGSTVGQLARLNGCHVIAGAGGAEKCAWCEELGFETFDHLELAPDVALARLAPEGIDYYWDNVQGEHLAAAIDALRPHGTIVACGGASSYNATAVAGPANLHKLFTKALTVRGFRWSDHSSEYGRFLNGLDPLVSAGTVRHCERVFDGLASAPDAFTSLFTSTSPGKVVVRL
jgi:NADPH-dependent curcumin reductase CurA